MAQRCVGTGGFRNHSIKGYLPPPALSTLSYNFRSFSSPHPKKIWALILPSLVHSWNATSQTTRGSTHLAGALAFGFGSNGQVSVKYGLSSLHLSYFNQGSGSFLRLNF